MTKASILFLLLCFIDFVHCGGRKKDENADEEMDENADEEMVERETSDEQEPEEDDEENSDEEGN